MGPVMQVERNVMGGLLALMAICFLAAVTADFLH
jgi:hypothetical protein